MSKGHSIEIRIMAAAGIAVFLAGLAGAEVETDFVVATNAAATNYFLGNVGVGTNDPAVGLHVDGDARVDGALTVTGAMAVARQGDVSMGTYTNGAPALGSIDLGYWTQSPSGGVYTTVNVGIGTNTPQADLHVDGDLLLSTGATVGEFSTDGTLGGDSDTAVPTEKAVKTYVDDQKFPANCAATVYQSSGQSIPSSTWTTLDFNTEEFDNGSDFDLTNDKFTAPADGDYLVSATVLFNHIAGKALMIGIAKNTSAPNMTWGSETSPNINGYFSASTTKVIGLSSNDYLKIAIWHNAGSGRSTLGGLKYTYASFVRLSD